MIQSLWLHVHNFSNFWLFCAIYYDDVLFSNQRTSPIFVFSFLASRSEEYSDYNDRLKYFYWCFVVFRLCVCDCWVP